jgi:hypothetical protein
LSINQPSFFGVPAPATSFLCAPLLVSFSGFGKSRVA